MGICTAPEEGGFNTEACFCCLGRAPGRSTPRRRWKSWRKSPGSHLVGMAVARGQSWHIQPEGCGTRLFWPRASVISDGNVKSLVLLGHRGFQGFGLQKLGEDGAGTHRPALPVLTSNRGCR